MTREQKVEDCWKQYTEGAITFVEFANFVYSLVTQEELNNWNWN